MIATVIVFFLTEISRTESLFSNQMPELYTVYTQWSSNFFIHPSIDSISYMSPILLTQRIGTFLATGTTHDAAILFSFLSDKSQRLSPRILRLLIILLHRWPNSRAALSEICSFLSGKYNGGTAIWPATPERLVFTSADTPSLHPCHYCTFQDFSIDSRHPCMTRTFLYYTLTGLWTSWHPLLLWNWRGFPCSMNFEYNREEMRFHAAYSYRIWF